MSYRDEDYLASDLDEMPHPKERPHVVRRDMVKIHILKSVRDGMAVRSHARNIGASADFSEEAEMFILAVAGTFLQLACVQSYIDGMYRL